MKTDQKTTTPMPKTPERRPAPEIVRIGQQQCWFDADAGTLRTGKRPDES